MNGPLSTRLCFSHSFGFFWGKKNLLGFCCHVVYFIIFLQFCPRVYQSGQLLIVWRFFLHISCFKYSNNFIQKTIWKRRPCLYMVWPAVNCMVIFSSYLLFQIIKQLYSKNNLEEKTLSLYGYHHYAVLHMHKKWHAVDFIFLKFALKVSIESVVLSLLVGCL